LWTKHLVLLAASGSDSPLIDLRELNLLFLNNAEFNIST
jgi:hypothetical protein